MRRQALVFVLLIAAAIACEPLIHTHPLTQASPSPCAVCVNAVGRVTPVTAAVVLPLVIISTLTALIVSPTIRRAIPCLPSRAPPAN